MLLPQGGLGNQLFQVVLARTLAEHQGRRLVVDSVLLHSRLRRWRGLTPRSLSPLLSELLPDPRATPWHHCARERLAARLADRWPGASGDGARRDAVLTDAGLARAAARGELLEQLRMIRVLRTHATHPALYGAPFHRAWRAIAAALQPLAGPDPPTVALHARRGDYLHPRSGFLPLLPGYYQRALAAVDTLSGAGARGLRSDPEDPPPLHVFSDDPAWCQAHLTAPGWTPRLEAGRPETDLARLAAARVLILSNSSFSAVAAQLARLRDPATAVIAPDRWLLKEDGRLGDLRGPDWLTVEA
ncbi:MAG: hypothetical protein VKO44_02735 [Cyanobacteriota bacterium]|nr:hypothetical protein [Cyanobacteriota bacterium]